MTALGLWLEPESLRGVLGGGGDPLPRLSGWHLTRGRSRRGCPNGAAVRQVEGGGSATWPALRYKAGTAWAGLGQWCHQVVRQARVVGRLTVVPEIDLLLAGSSTSIQTLTAWHDYPLARTEDLYLR